MTRTYAAKRLLEHGPLTFRELVEITGWKPKTVGKVLERLRQTGVAYYYCEPGKSQNLHALT